MKKQLKLLTLLFGGVLALSGCNEFTTNNPNQLPSAEEMGIDTPWQDYTSPCTSISFPVSEANFSLNKGETHTYSYSVEPKNFNTSLLKWESDNENIATVTNGVLNAVGGGKANITLSYGDVSAHSVVNVVVPITDFNVLDKDITMDINGNTQIEYELAPVDTTQNKMRYETVNTDIISVSDAGLISALGKVGDAEVKVTNEVLNKVEIVNVHVSDLWNYVGTMTLNGPDKLEVGKSDQLGTEVIGVDPDAIATTLIGNKVSYSIKDGNEYISVNSETGEITGLEPGNATLVASLLEERSGVTLTREKAIEVFEIKATGISLNETGTIELDNKDNLSHQLSYTYTLSDASASAPSRGNVTFTSSDASVAKVNDDGLIEVVGKGSATIKVKDVTYDVSDSVEVHTTIYAKSVSLSASGDFYLDETIEVVANVTPQTTSESLVWDYDEASGHTFVEQDNKLIVTCNNLDNPVVVKASVGSTQSEDLTLTPKEREVFFEDGKTYIVGSSNYKTGISKDAGKDGSWDVAKYAFVMTDKTGNVDAKYEYKATIEFRENDLWKIRENKADWKEIQSKDNGEYKINEGAFAKGQMSVEGTPESGNVLVKEAGKYDVYYAFYENGNPQGWYSVYVEEHGMKLSSTSVHAKLTSSAVASIITASNYEGTLSVEDVDSAYISASVDQLTGNISITPIKIGETSFKVKDAYKEIIVNVEIKEGSEAEVTDLYLRGTAVGTWEPSDANILRKSKDENNIAEILDVYIGLGEFKISDNKWTENRTWGYEYEKRSTISGGAASKFSAGEKDNNIKCNAAGYYNIYLTKNNYIYIESVGGDEPVDLSTYYLRGDAVGSWSPLPENQMTLMDGNKAVKLNVSLDVGQFKIGNADWSESWGYKYKNQDEQEDHITIMGGASANFSEGKEDGNINCDVAGRYNIYLTTNNYISIEHAEFALSATSATIETGESYVVSAHNLTGVLSYEVTDGVAEVAIVDNKATITSSTIGTATIVFSDESEDDPITFTLTVTPPVAKHRYYIETKNWFNSGDPNEHVYVYAFKQGSDKVNAIFPGEKASYVKDLSEGKKLFYYDVAESFDTFIVSKVVGTEKTYQTTDIVISELSGDNCVYLKDQPASTDTAVEIGHYNYAFGLSASSGTISKGKSTTVTFTNYIGEVTYEVSPAGSATVSIKEGVATITSSTIGTSTITFSDESDSEAKAYTLTVQDAPVVKRIYFETKTWFNSNQKGEDVYAYVFNSSTHAEKTAWPGESTQWAKDLTEGKKLFYFDVSDEYDSIIFVRTEYGESKAQTVDILIADMGAYNCVYLKSEVYESTASVGYYTYSE